MSTQPPRLTETAGTLLRAVNTHAEQLGWALRELGIGVVAERSPDGGTAIRLTAYRNGAPVGLATDDLIEGLTGEWQAADQYPAIDGAD